jgi:Cu(I)/Ag(I) efflux system protein CusF
MKQLLVILTATALSIGSVPMAAAQAKQGQTHKGTGVVTSVDRAAGKVTLKHEAIQSLNWPGMTMAFAVKDKAMLDKLAEGKKVEFELTQDGNQYVITSIK